MRGSNREVSQSTAVLRYKRFSDGTSIHIYLRETSRSSILCEKAHRSPAKIYLTRGFNFRLTCSLFLFRQVNETLGVPNDAIHFRHRQIIKTPVNIFQTNWRKQIYVIRLGVMDLSNRVACCFIHWFLCYQYVY